jgi:hypothetical protein
LRWFGEHHAEGRNHGVEGAVLERQLLGVRHLEFHLQALRLGPDLPALQQLLDVVGRRDAAKAACEGERCIAIAGGDVEHRRVRPQVHRLGQVLADDLQRRADPGVVARRPGRVLFRLDHGVVGCWRNLGHGGHWHLLAWTPAIAVVGGVGRPDRYR